MTDRGKNLIAGLILITPVILWRAYVAAALYGWFAPPAWGVISFRTFCGLALVGTMLIVTSGKRESDPFDLGYAVFSMLVGPLAALALGWLIKTMI